MQTSHQPALNVLRETGMPLQPASFTGPGQPRPDALAPLAVTVTVPREAEIYAQGDPARFAYQVVRGCVRTVKLMEDGRRQVNDFLMPGDWFGFEALETHEFAAEAITDTLLRRVPRRALDALAERDAGVTRWLLNLAAGQLRAAREHMVTLARMSASERIAGFLIATARRLPTDAAGCVPLPMSRTDIGDYLGLTIETVCRTLAQFRRDGVIRLSRDGFTVASAPGLRAHASATRH